MLKVGDKLICKTEGQPETEFCIRGEVKKVEGDIVTISRALKFGTLPMHKDLTLPESELLKYYTPLDNQATDDCPVSGSIYEVTIVRTGVVFVRAATSLQPWILQTISQPIMLTGQMTGAPPTPKNAVTTTAWSLRSLTLTDYPISKGKENRS